MNPFDPNTEVLWREIMFLSHMAQWLALILCIVLVAAVWYLFGRIHEIQRDFDEHKKGVRHRVRRKIEIPIPDPRALV